MLYKMVSGLSMYRHNFWCGSLPKRNGAF